MLYFKHHSSMRNDIKLKRVISRYGLEGYGLYNLILESITESLSTDSPLPDLQENCEDIAEFYNGNTAKINEIMNFMINQGLFDIDEITGAVLCSKLYKYLDTSQTRSEKLRQMIKNYKSQANLLIESNYEPSQTVSDKSDRTEEEQKKNRTEREEEKKVIKEEFECVWREYPKKIAKKACIPKYLTLHKKGLLPCVEEHINIINKYKKTERWQKGYIPDPATWFNQERWNDDIPEPWEDPEQKAKTAASATKDKTWSVCPDCGYMVKTIQMREQCPVCGEYGTSFRQGRGKEYPDGIV